MEFCQKFSMFFFQSGLRFWTSCSSKCINMPLCVCVSINVFVCMGVDRFKLLTILCLKQSTYNNILYFCVVVIVSVIIELGLVGNQNRCGIPKTLSLKWTLLRKRETHRYYLILGRILSKSAMISEDDAGDERACGIHFGGDICFPNGFKHFGIEGISSDINTEIVQCFTWLCVCECMRLFAMLLESKAVSVEIEFSYGR